MRYNLKHGDRPQPQTTTLNWQEEAVLIDWSERYGVSVERIQQAVQTVGNRVADVVRYLMDGGKKDQQSL